MKYNLVSQWSPYIGKMTTFLVKCNFYFTGVIQRPNRAITIIISICSSLVKGIFKGYLGIYIYIFTRYIYICKLSVKNVPYIVSYSHIVVKYYPYIFLIIHFTNPDLIPWPLTSISLSFYFLGIAMLGSCPPKATVAQSAVGSARPVPAAVLERVVQSGTDRIVPHLVSSAGRCVQSRAAFPSSSVKALWNPVNLSAQSAMAKTASDAPYLLTERDLAQRVCLTRLTGEAFHAWRVYGTAGFRPTCISTCKSRANDANLKSLFLILAVELFF